MSVEGGKVIIMEESLKKLVNYVKPGAQNLLVMSGRGSRVQTSFNPPLEYDSTNVGYEMCLNSFGNILFVSKYQQKQ